jgi:hypothetical protein
MNMPTSLNARHDRWIEIDLAWFSPEKNAWGAPEAVARLAPLLRAATASRGVVLNCQWLVDLITEWRGDLSQKLPFQGKVPPAWQGVPYANLKFALTALREALVGEGMADTHIGVLFHGRGCFIVANLYGNEGSWSARHPELYPPGGADIDPRRPLAADTYPYASKPGGIEAGTTFAALFGAQWGHFSRAIGFDAIVLRDGFLGSTLYARVGPWGVAPPPSPADAAEWHAAIAGIYRELKRARPDALVLGYSSAASAIGEYRIGAFDLEQLVADGDIDLWIDQTWGGAWQDFWSWERLGWTFQLAHLLVHRTMIAAGNARRAGAPCRHLHLIETWDAFEPWDTMHQVPEKLRWAIWAFSHAAVETPAGPRLSDGAYISWATDYARRLLSPEDITWLSTHLDAADADAADFTGADGATLLVCRDSVRWLAANHPRENALEWIDDQAGLLMKWGVSCLSAAPIAWADAVPVERLLLAQAAGTRGDESAATAISARAAAAPALVLTGRADTIHPRLCEQAGVSPTGALANPGYRPLGEVIGPVESPPIPCVFVRAVQPLALPAAHALATAGDQFLLTRHNDRPLYVWQAQDWADNTPAQNPIRRSQFGSTRIFSALAAALQADLAAAGQAHLDAIPTDYPVAFHAWRTRSGQRFLLGNLETGMIGDSRYPRAVRLRVPAADTTSSLRDLATGTKVEPVVTEAGWHVYDLTLPADGCLLLTT